jgi:hypothetical protein
VRSAASQAPARHHRSLAAWHPAQRNANNRASKNYLDRFASPIELDATLFVTCFLGMLCVALLTVGAQILRAAHARPSDSLRHE